MKTIKPNMNNHQAGIVSILTVIFMAIMLSIVALGFIKLMVGDQQQATSQDLSRSAYDSALAGTEDAKRVLLMNEKCNGSTTGNCATIRSAIASKTCDTISKAGLASVETSAPAGSQEIKIKQSTGTASATYDQAYTCVKINRDLDDYLGTLNRDEGTVIPLQSTSAFDRIEISWFNTEDLVDKNRPNLKLQTSDKLPTLGSWGTASADAPGMMRAQLINGNAGSLEALSSGTGSPHNTAAFMYPTAGTAPSEVLPTSLTKQSKPQAAKCSAAVTPGNFACRQVVRLPSGVSGAPGSTIYLNLIALYSGPNHFKIRLLNGNSAPTAAAVNFAGIQAEIDSTGRANNYFRRVASRVELTGKMKYPISVADIDGNICKVFHVMNKPMSQAGPGTPRAYDPACNP